MNQPPENPGLHIVLISLHGLIRADRPELGRDVDTGGQIKYVLELAIELARRQSVAKVDLVTRQVIDDSVDPAYAQVEEVISDKAKIIRIPFGPKKYLGKEALWPYMDLFVDQMSNHFRRSGLPSLIHGHYADGGYGGAQLARMLHIPFVFTGHSLGRVKRQRMSAANHDSTELEKKYNFRTRVEAEEFALETASMVVASTNQEVQEQYELYQHYVPDTMEVIPPGVGLKQFRPPTPNEDHSKIRESLVPFLRDPDKPFIFAMARPDERKNTKVLVKVFGENKDLQELANLVLVVGTREDIRKMPTAQRGVMMELLAMIDKYDLYGKVAYPKNIRPEHGPQLYRFASDRRGVFINPALTEPFGLTLLEAAAVGLPIIATNDGGPRDILANCEDGMLIDPLDEEDVARALRIALTEPDQWQRWSENGIKGATEHYSWSHHVDRYLRDIKEIVKLEDNPVLGEGLRTFRLPEFDRLMITDLDCTLTGNDEYMQKFCELVRKETRMGFGIATGRRLDDATAQIKKLDLPQPDLIITSSGTELYYGPKLTPDVSWQKQIDYSWEPEKVREVLAQVDGLFPQEEVEQSKYKVSYTVDTNEAPSASKIRRMLRSAGLRAKVIFSLGMFLDVLPVRGGNGPALRHLLFKWGFPPEQVLVAGDSGLDEEMLRGRTLGVVVGNHGPELHKLKNQPRIYFADAHHAQGILEGIDYYQFTGTITIPNDQPE